MNFWTKLNQKENFQSKKEETENHNQILLIWISLGFKFQLQQTILIFWNKFPAKRIHPGKNRKNEHHHWILQIPVRLNTKFKLKLALLIFGSNLLKKGISGRRQKSEHRHGILHVLISPGIKFHFRQTIWILGLNLPKKRLFQSKMEKVNTTIEFYRFELVEVPNFGLNWQLWFFGLNLPSSLNTNYCVRPCSFLTIFSFSARGLRPKLYLMPLPLLVAETMKWRKLLL